MLFELNTKKSPFLFVGQHRFAPDNLEIDINVADIDPSQKKQLLYNVLAGVLKTSSSLDELRGHNPVRTAEKPFVDSEKPESQEQVLQHLEDQKKRLSKILKKGVSSVKKEAVEMNQKDLAKLMELETEGKARKSVMAFLKERIEKIALPAFPATDVGETGVSKTKSNLVGDIEESEQETIIFTQGVLDQLEE